MIVRIVKLSFHAEFISDFKTIFEQNKQNIISQKGCSRLEMLQDINNLNVFLTYSWWNSEENLNNYRNSDLFKTVWKKTKVLFNKKPEAWSTNKINEAL
tara:strand:- start:1371 stop:1667 length:297 start_codon:yes stop_codon:yes gene_type:complete